MPDASAGSAVWPRKPDRDRSAKPRRRRPPSTDSRNLLMRVVAALVLAPLAIAIAYAGGWLWTALVTLAAIGLFVEWLMVVGRGGATARHACRARPRWRSPDFALRSAGSMPRSMVLALGFVAVVRSLLGSGAAGPRRDFSTPPRRRSPRSLVRLDRAKGFAALMLVLLVVWVTDIGGYFAGRGIGGPKLWPRVSPKKTWAGAVGGFAASLAVAVGFAAFGLGKIGAAADAGRGPLGCLAARRSLRIRREAPFWRKGLQSHNSRPWRANGSSGRICRGHRRWRRFSGFCAVAPMASAAVLWFGETMSAVPLRNNKAAASAVRSVTVLGATGSIGDSTMDLLRGARDRYRVEALTAQQQCRRRWPSSRRNSTRALPRSPTRRGSAN